MNGEDECPCSCELEAMNVFPAADLNVCIDE